MAADVEALLAAMRAGDEAAGSTLVERYRPFVVTRLRSARHARNWFWLDDLDDVAQEVLVRFVEAVRGERFRFRDESQLRGFLVRTTFYTVMKRRDQITTALDDDDAPRPHPLSAEQAAAFDLSAFADAAFDTIGRRQCLDELYRAVDSLQEARSEVLRLTLLGFAPREIAPVMGRSANAVSVLKTHALEDLRAALEQSDFMTNCGRYFLGG